MSHLYDVFCVCAFSVKFYEQKCTAAAAAADDDDDAFYWRLLGSSATLSSSCYVCFL